jgi:hypothetical protein
MWRQNVMKFFATALTPVSLDLKTFMTGDL